MSEGFERSLSDGPHALLARLAGRWSGSTKTWFEPDQLADESPTSGQIRQVAGGRFVVHEYDSSLQGTAHDGLVLLGYDLARRTFTCAWCDSFHTGTQVITLEGRAIEDGFAVRGEYAAPSGPPWGWRIELRMPTYDSLVITMFNIAPDGEEARAVETELVRQLR